MSDLTRPAIEKIEEMAVKALKKDTFIKMPGDPAHVVHQLQTDGSYKRERVEPAPYLHEILTPGALVDFVNDKGTAKPDAAIFYSDEELVFVANREDFLDKARVRLVQSDQLVFLEDNQQVKLSQAELIFALRVKFRGCLIGTPNLLPAIRNLKWASASSADAVVQHGNESMGRSVSARVTGEGDIPTEIAFDIPMFDNYEFRARVDCALEIYPADQKFRIIPFPGELENAKKRAMDAICKDLAAAEGVPLFNGMIRASDD